MVSQNEGSSLQEMLKWQSFRYVTRGSFAKGLYWHSVGDSVLKNEIGFHMSFCCS